MKEVAGFVVEEILDKLDVPQNEVKVIAGSESANEFGYVLEHKNHIYKITNHYDRSIELYYRIYKSNKKITSFPNVYRMFKSKLIDFNYIDKHKIGDGDYRFGDDYYQFEKDDFVFTIRMEKITPEVGDEYIFIREYYEKVLLDKKQVGSNLNNLYSFFKNLLENPENKDEIENIKKAFNFLIKFHKDLDLLGIRDYTIFDIKKDHIGYKMVDGKKELCLIDIWISDDINPNIFNVKTLKEENDFNFNNIDLKLRFPKTHKVIFVSPEKLLKIHGEHQPDFDVRNKKNQIGNRVEKAKQYIIDYNKDQRWIHPIKKTRSNSTFVNFEPSVVEINLNNKIGFIDGRHRVLAAYELGIDKVPIEVPKDQADKIYNIINSLNENKKEISNIMLNENNEITQKFKNYKIPFAEVNNFLINEYIPYWKKEYNNDIKKINFLVAQELLFKISQDLFGGVNQVSFNNESKEPTNHFQLTMDLGDYMLCTSPFIYVDNNHKIIAKKTNIEILNNDYETIKTLKENNINKADRTKKSKKEMNNIKKVALLLIKIKNKFLFFKRSEFETTNPNKYGMLGGGIEKNETPKQAIIREVKEEANVDLKNFKFFKKYIYNKTTELNIFYTEKFPINEIKLDKKEHTSFELFSLKEILNNEEMISTNKKIIKDFLNKDKLNENDPKTGTGKKPKNSGRRLYTDENPKDTVRVKFKTIADVKDTLSKTSFKTKSHARQSQIINLIHQRVRAAYQNAKNSEVKSRLKKVYDYISKRKEISKQKTKKLNKLKEYIINEQQLNLIKKNLKELFDLYEPEELNKKDINYEINLDTPTNFTATLNYKDHTYLFTIYQMDDVDNDDELYDTHTYVGFGASNSNTNGQIVVFDLINSPYSKRIGAAFIGLLKYWVNKYNIKEFRYYTTQETKPIRHSLYSYYINKYLPEFKCEVIRDKKHPVYGNRDLTLHIWSR